MYSIDKSKVTKKYSNKNNTNEYILLHHTGHGNINATTENVTDYLAFNQAEVSCHFVVGTERDKKIYQIAELNRTTWHAGITNRAGPKYMNDKSIGIEIMSHDGLTFDARQKSAVRWLVGELIKYAGIKDESKILRHKDIAPGRKIDIGDNFRKNEFSSFDEYKKTLFSPISTRQYTEQELSKIKLLHNMESIIMNYRSNLWNEIDDDMLRELLHQGNESSRGLHGYIGENIINK